MNEDLGKNNLSATKREKLVKIEFEENKQHAGHIL
jgi:hypothetical protein